MIAFADPRLVPRLQRANHALVFLALAVAVGMSTASYRTIEALSAGGLFTAIYDSATYVNRSHSTMYVGLGEPNAFAIHVTPQCSTAALVVGLLIATAAAAFLPRLTLNRLFLAVAGAGAVFFVANVLRLLAVVWAAEQWGLDRGFRLSHTYLGTWMTTAGGIAAVAFYLFVLGISPRKLLRWRSQA